MSSNIYTHIAYIITINSFLFIVLRQHISNNFEHFVCVQRHFAAVDAKRYVELWLMNEDEAQALAHRAVALDRVIHEQVLGLTWSPLPLPFMDHSSPKQLHRTTQEVAAQVLDEKNETQDQTERERSPQEDSDSLESSIAGVDHKTMKRLLELLSDEMVSIVCV